MSSQKVKVGKGRVHLRVKAQPVGSEKAQKLIATYVTEPEERRRAIVEEWCMLVKAGIPYAAIAEEYNTSITSVSVAVTDPDEWVRRGSCRRRQAAIKGAETRRRRRGGRQRG